MVTKNNSDCKNLVVDDEEPNPDEIQQITY